MAEVIGEILEIVDKNVETNGDVFELDKIHCFEEVASARNGSISSIGSFGAEISFPAGRGGRKRSSKVSVCSSVSIRTMSDGTPPYISIMSRKDSVATERAAPVPDQAWVGQNNRFVRGKKGRSRKKNIQQANMFEDYQKKVQDRIKDASAILDEGLDEEGEFEVGS